MRSKTLPFAAALAVLATSMLLSAAVPAAATAIHHTNRAAGDPDAISAVRSQGAPPADTSGPHNFDKAHETGGVR